MPPSQYKRAQQQPGMWIPSNPKRKPLHKRISSASNFHEIAPDKPKKRVIHFRRFSQPTLYGPGRRSNPHSRRGSLRSLNKKDPLYKIKSKHRRIVSNGHSFSGASDFGDPRPYQNLMYKVSEFCAGYIRCPVSFETNGRMNKSGGVTSDQEEESSEFWDPTHAPDPFDEFGETPDLNTKLSRRFKTSPIATPAPIKMDGFKTRRFSAPTQPYLEEVAKLERTFQSKLTFDSRRKRRDQQIKHKKKLAKIFYEKEGEQPGFVQPTVGGVLTASAEHSCSHSRSPVSSSTPCEFEGEPGALPPAINSLRLAAELAGQETRTRRREKYITRFGEQRCRTILTF